MSNDYINRVCFITGGGRGFGKAFGHALASRGSNVILADIDYESAVSSAKDIVEAGGFAKGVRCDVSEESEVQEVIASVSREFGGIDILINNAGLHSQLYNGTMESLGLDKIRKLFDVNVFGTINCSLVAKPYMSNRPGASIVNISSTASYAGSTTYGASKLAVQGVTMTMAREFAGDGLRVNGIAPGLIFTDTIRSELSQDIIENVKSMQILLSDGAEKDIVDAMLFLTSSSASFITGETLRVSGGFALGI